MFNFRVIIVKIIQKKGKNIGKCTQKTDTDVTDHSATLGSFITAQASPHYCQ